MIAIIDYGMGNLHSVYNALQAIGAQAEITNTSANTRHFILFISFPSSLKNAVSDQLLSDIKTVEGGKVVRRCLRPADQLSSPVFFEQHLSGLQRKELSRVSLRTEA